MDAMRERNAEVEAVAGRYRWRTMKLGDGELVVRLPGKDGAHAGRWGRSASYLLIPCQSPERRMRILRGSYPGLIDRSGDIELLALGPHEVVERILAEGPSWARARRRNAPQSAHTLGPFARRRRDAVPAQRRAEQVPE